MAQSMDDIQPDLNKAPPHVEGELLKENVKTTFGRRGWRKYFFVVRGDKLQYFRKKDEYETNKEPITYVKMSQVVEITEAVYSGVPKKHHLNCGFSVVSYHPHTQEEQTFHLLAETPEDMRYWVHGLRYIKAYWSKMMVRDTVLSEEQERKLLDRILNEEDYERGDEVYGDYTIGEGGQSDETTSRQVAVHFANGSKVKVTLSTTETTSDLLEMSEIKEQLSSSSAYIVRVDEVGKDVILETQDHPALYHSKSSTLYAVEHSHRLLVVYIDNQKDFECIYVSPHATDTEIIQHREISVKLDMTGVGNRGLFLKLRDSEQPFGLGESPCDVLFEMNINGELRRLPVGHLVVKNKALGGGRSTSRITRRWINRSTTHRPVRSVSDEGKKLEEISEEEDAQAMALDNFFNRMGGARVELDSTTELEIDGMVYVLPPDFNKDSKRLSSGSVNSDRSDESKHDEDHGLEDLTSPSSSRPHSGSMGGLRRSRLRPGDKFSNSSPSGSPATSPPRSRSKSPGRRLPDLPAKDSSVPKMSPSQQKKSQTLDKDFKGSPGALKRRGATRAGSLRSSNLSEGGHGYHNQPRGSWTEGVSKKNEDPPEVKVGMAAAKMGVVEPAESEEKVGTSPLSLHKRGPTIILSNEKGGVVGDARTDRPTLTTRPRSPSNRGSMVFDNLNLGDSRSSSFGRSQSPAGDNLLSSLPASIEQQEVTIPNVSLSLTSSFGAAAAPSVDDEARLEHLFSRSFQQEQEEKSSHITKQVDTLSAKVKAVTEGSKEQKNVPRESPNVSPSHQFTPMLIDFAALQAPPTSPSETAPSKPTASTINVTSPSFLKVILLQSSTVADATEETKPMDFINLSGVCLRNERGAWQIQDGYNYHDPLPFDCTDHTETFPLPGGIRVVYNHTHKRWHVYPPPPISSAPSVDEDRSMADSTEHAQPKEEVDSRESSTEVSLYLTKKLIVTEIGTAFHHVMEQFEVSRDQAGKKKIGSDMVNVAMGHLIRGEFCTAIAKLLLDGMKPYRLEGLIQDDVWKVTVAFSNEAQSNPSLVYPSFDKLVFQPINSLKTLMKDYNIKYRTFVCLAMSRGMLTGFLEALPKQNTCRLYVLDKLDL
ncbi:uncharacterized protein LOC135336189 isoform X2 [Halichondria panicea]|uniref:uncharacterized protein LOC135336189 isoform X2 n=1 Tax=Halichondria panicea TaxID=6063 RepID=UPI00312B7ED6